MSNGRAYAGSYGRSCRRPPLARRLRAGPPAQPAHQHGEAEDQDAGDDTGNHLGRRAHPRGRWCGAGIGAAWADGIEERQQHRVGRHRDTACQRAEARPQGLTPREETGDGETKEHQKNAEAVKSLHAGIRRRGAWEHDIHEERQPKPSDGVDQEADERTPF